MSILVRVPSWIVNFVSWSHEVLRRAMAIQTPFHVQRVHPPSDRHLIDATVTSRAANSFGYVNAVIEINVIGQIMDAVPFQRRVCRQALRHRREERGVVENLRMPGHASFARGHAGETGFLD